MFQRQLDRDVARATGESLREIRRRGFSLASSESGLDLEPDDAPPQTVDWDELDELRVALFP